MAKKIIGKLLIAAVVSGLALSSVGCATMTWNAPFVENGSPASLETAAKQAGDKEIGSYMVLGPISIGASKYQSDVKAALRQGKSIDILHKNFVIFNKIIAYAKN
jgi:hypothetical protein